MPSSARQKKISPSSGRTPKRGRESFAQPSSTRRYPCESFAAIQSCFSFNDTATTEIYTLSLHDALPISSAAPASSARPMWTAGPSSATGSCRRDRKSTRLNSSHVETSYAVFCLKKKKKKIRSLLIKKKKKIKKKI